MKKLLLVGSAMAMLSTSAMASQARLLALGMNETDNEGMYHISDRRNMFLNPAYINIYNNYVTVEYGDKGQNASVRATDSATTLDSNTNPKAQGGFFTKQGNFVYGFYMGNESNTSALLRAAGTSAFASVDGATGAPPAGFANVNSKMLHSADNQFDLFFGGGEGLKWGVNATVANGKDDTRKAKDSALSLRSGVIGSNWDAHLNVSLASKAKATDSITAFGVTQDVAQEFKGKLGLQFGGSYVFSGNNRAFGYVKHYGWEQKDSFTTYGGPLASIGGQTGTVKGDFTSAVLGWGTHHDVNNTDKIYLSVSAKKTDINAKFANKAEVRHLVLPVSVAYEAVATEWLTLRGSVIHNLWGQRDNKNANSLNPVARGLITGIYGNNGKGSLTNSTEVRGGATFTFGNLEVDGLVGVKATGSLQTDELLSRAAVTYTF